MGYYSVIILVRVYPGKYRPEYVYFGEEENMMRVRFYDAVRLAQSMPTAEYVVIWRDLAQLAKVKIEH